MVDIKKNIITKMKDKENANREQKTWGQKKVLESLKPCQTIGVLFAAVALLVVD